ncbi:MAG: hypothetical protein GY927_25240 [bacterium]|nr:hypothetical protein [bacterium]
MTSANSPEKSITQSDAEEFWVEMETAVSHAHSVHPVTWHELTVVGCSVALTCVGKTVAGFFLPALAHLENVTSSANLPMVQFSLCDTATSGLNPPPIPFSAADYFRYGQRAVYHNGELSIMHILTETMILAYNRRERRGILWTRDASALSIYERAAPLQSLFYWALEEFGWQIVHAAALGRADGGVLLVGNSGAGKSTTALSVIQDDELRYLSDDKCLVRLGQSPTAFSIFNSAKLNEDMLDALPQFRPLIADWDAEFKIGKGLAFLYPNLKEKMIRSFPIRALLIPRIANREKPKLTPANGIDAFRVLGPSTVIWLPGAEANSYRFLAQLVRSVPCYFLDLAASPGANLPAIAEVIDTHAGVL